MITRVAGSALLTVMLVVVVWATSIGSSAAQRTRDGQPDIQGVWGSFDSGIYSLALEPMAHLQTIGMPRSGGLIQSNSGPTQGALGNKKTIVVDPPSGIIPHQPWALERRNSVMRGYVSPKPWQIDTQTPGWPNGIPRIHVYSSLDGSIGGPWHILQGPGYVLFLYETQHEFRYIPLDPSTRDARSGQAGTARPGKDIKLWMGSSRGRWEGNMLVIETTNNNDSPRLDVVGNFRSDEMRITERFTLVDKDTLEYRATMDDPKVYTRPWTIAITNTRTPPGTELIEYAGVEGDLNATLATGAMIPEGGKK